MSEPTIYKPSIYNGNGVYKNGASGGGGGGGIVPDEYEELEYLEINRNNGGANFIATLNTFSNADKDFSIIVEFDGVNEDYQKNLIKFSAQAWSSSPGFSIDYVNRTDNTRTIYSRNNGGDYYTPIYTTNDYTNKVKFSIKNNNFDITYSDGRKTVLTTNYASSNFSNMFLFTDRTNPGEYYQFWGKFYEMEVNGVLKLVPVKRKLDGVIGLFDLVSQVFITANYGQSNIIAGPVKL